MKRIERVRLYPTSRQRVALARILRVTCDLYNAALQERRDAYKRGVRITCKMQSAELTQLRLDDERLRSIYREIEDAVLHRLDLAFEAFFRRVKLGEKPGHPRFKPARRWKQFQFSHGNRALKFDVAQDHIRVPGVGNVRLRKGRRVPGFGRAWIVERNGRWHGFFECERDPVQGPVDCRKVVGVDRGVRVLAATSDGELIANIAVAEKRRSATSRLQRQLDRLTEKDELGRVRNRHDAKRVAAARRLARSKERESNSRRDYAHKVARRIMEGKAQVVALEALPLSGMTRSAKGTLDAPGRNVRAKAGLNRVILDAGFGLLERMITAKAEEAGKWIVRVDPRFTSQECSRCGHIASQSRRRRRYRCVACGFACHADVNAALVIRRRAELRLLRIPDTGAKPVMLRGAA